MQAATCKAELKLLTLFTNYKNYGNKPLSHIQKHIISLHLLRCESHMDFRNYWVIMTH